MATERYLALPPMPEDYEPPRPVAHEEYLRLTETLPGTYEYHAGLMYPRFYPPGSHWFMDGGTAAHAQLIVALIAALREHLGNRGPCRVYPSDMKLRTLENDYFPDAYVACGDTGPNQRRLEDAILICEYLILDNRRPQATLHRKDDDGTWTYLVFTAGATVLLDTIDLTLAVDDLYEGVTLDPDPMRLGKG